MEKQPLCRLPRGNESLHDLGPQKIGVRSSSPGVVIDLEWEAYLVAFSTFFRRGGQRWSVEGLLQRLVGQEAVEAIVDLISFSQVAAPHTLAPPSSKGAENETRRSSRGCTRIAACLSVHACPEY